MADYPPQPPLSGHEDAAPLPAPPAPAPLPPPSSSSALPLSLDNPKSLSPPASTSLPTPPTTSYEHQHQQQQDTVPPPSLSIAPPPPSLDHPQVIPPPPVQPLSAVPHLDPPHKLVHSESSSSIAAQPPTPAAQPPPPAIAPPQFTPEPAPLPPAIEQQPPMNGTAPDQQEQEAYTNGFHQPHSHDAPTEVPLGAHPGLGALPHPNGDVHAAVEFIADSAMGEAALGLADFAAGAGSADVREGSPAVGGPGEAVDPALSGGAQGQGHAQEYSPSLKRSADEADGGDLFGLNGLGGESAADREAKRLRVDVEPSPDYAPAPPSVQDPSLSLSTSLAPPAPSSIPSDISPSPAPSAVQGFDPSAFTSAPTFASSAPPYQPPAPSAAMSPSDLLNQYNAASAGSPLIAPPSSVNASAVSPLPPTPAPAPAATTPMYASPDAFSHQPQASTSAAGAQPFHPGQLPPLGGSGGTPQPGDGQASASGSVPPPPAGDAPAPPPGPPEAKPIHLITKEQQKFAINMVRNLKRNKNAFMFLKPVDHIALNIPDYYRIITQPMDLGKVEARLQATGKGMAAAAKAGKIYGLDYSLGKEGALWEGQVPPEKTKPVVEGGEGEEPSYRTIEEFKADLDRVWENCFKYNGPREKNPVSNMAGLLSDASNKSFRQCPLAPTVSPYPPPPAPKPDPSSIPYHPPSMRHAAADRPKREIHAPVKDLAYLESAGLDPTAGGIYNLSGLPQHGGAGGFGGYGQPVKQRKSGGAGGVSGKTAQEQLRFCKATLKELFGKQHAAYAFPFYQPVDVHTYPTYLQYVKKPMDLSTIRSKLELNQYPAPPYAAFEADVRQIFKNCYAFNPPGTQVNDWGHQLESVFEHKWAERPLADADDDSDEEDGLLAMEQQLHMMQANLEAMRANKKAAKEAKRYAQMQQRMSAPKPQVKRPPPQPQPNPYAMSAYQSAPPPMPRHSSGGSGGAAKKPGGTNKGGAHTHKKKKKRHDSDSDDYYDDDDGGAYYGAGGGGGGGGGSRRRGAAPVEQWEEYVDFEMKRELAVKIVAFEGEQLEEAINIIRRGRPDLLGAANQEIELDIDQLDQYTLLNLYRFVCPGAKPAVRLVPAAPKAAKTGGGGANARKNLDEEKEAARIEALEAQLMAFESAGGAGTPAAADASRRGSEADVPQGEAGGDQASSDSSDEDSSEDSDED